ncbi:MAG: DUF447 domain-containing protein [Halanaeroarchaeum sp.]
MTEWPRALEGTTETVVTTLGPNDRWNAAALGISAGAPVTARTWGQTRTRRNFRREGEGYVQFVTDPELFVTAALGIHETTDPILEAAHAWVRVTVTRRTTGTTGGTEWATWALEPVETSVVDRQVPALDRGLAAVVEATVAASRLTVPAYDRNTLESRLAHLASVVASCGGPAEQRAIRAVAAQSSWSPDADVLPSAPGNESF